MKNKNIILFIIFTLFFNILPVKADIAPPPFSRADMWINKKGLPVFPSAEQKRNYKGYESSYTGLEKIEAIPIYKEEQDKTIFIDKDKKTVLELEGKGYIYPLNEGLIAKFDNGKCGFVDTNGNWVVEPKYTPMCMRKEANRGFIREYKCNTSTMYFSEGLAAVKYDEKPIVKFENKTYAAVIPEDYTYPEYRGYAVYGRIKDNKFYLSNEKTSTSGHLDYEYKTGYIDKTSNIVIKTDYDVLYPFSEGLALFKKSVYSQKYGYIDKKGKVVIKPKYTYANSFNNGIAKVEIGTGYFLLPFSAILLLLVIIAAYLARRDMKK